MLSGSLYMPAAAYSGASVLVDSGAVRVHGGAAYILSFDASASEDDITVSVCAENGDEIGSAAVKSGAADITAYSAPIVMPEAENVKGTVTVDITVSPSGADVSNIKLSPASEDIICEVQKDGALTVWGSLDNSEPGTAELYILKDAEEYEYTDSSRVVYHTTLNVGRYSTYSEKIDVDGIQSYYSDLTAVLCGLKSLGYVADSAAKSFRYTKTQLRDELADKLKNAESAAETKELIEGGDSEFPNMKLLGISDIDIVSEFDSLDFLYSYLYEKRAEITSDSISKITVQACILHALNGEKPESERLAAYIDEYAEVLGLTDAAFTPYGEVYAKKTAAVKGDIVSRLRESGKAVSMAALPGEFAQQTIHTVLNNCTNYSEIESLLLKNAAYLGIESLDGISEQQKQTLCSYAKTTDDIRTVKNKLAELENEDSGGGTTGGGTSGGGKGSGGGRGGSSGGGATSPSYQDYFKSDGVQDTKTDVPEKDKFSDVDGTFWAAQYIEKLAKQDIIAGYEDNSFRPQSNITRAELAKLAAAAFGIERSGKAAEFSDVAESDWSYEYIQALASCGIVNGTEDGRFLKDEYVTREDMTKILYGVAAYKGIKAVAANTAFADAEEISGYAREAVGAMCGLGIISGTDGNLFKPHDFATRAEVAKVICMLMELK